METVIRAGQGAAEKAGDSPSQLTFWTLIVSDGVDPIARLQAAASTRVAAVQNLGGVGLLLIDDVEPFLLSSWPARPGVLHLLSTVPASDGRWKRVERWVAHAAPSLAPSYLSENDFLAVGDALSEFGDVVVSKITARREDGSSLSQGFPRRRPSLAQAVAQLDPRSQVRTALMRAGDVMSIHLRRLSGATLYSGDFQAFAACVLARLEHATEAQRDLFDGRVRLRSQPPPDPLRIRLAEPFFDGPEQTGELLAALDRMPHLAVGLVHRNPYFHATVSDFADGSNFDVFVTSADEVVVHPGFRASIGSFARLVQHLSDAFPCRDLATKPLQPVNGIADLLAADG